MDGQLDNRLGSKRARPDPHVVPPTLPHRDSIHVQDSISGGKVRLAKPKLSPAWLPLGRALQSGPQEYTYQD